MSLKSQFIFDKLAFFMGAILILVLLNKYFLN